MKHSSDNHTQAQHDSLTGPAASTCRPGGNTLRGHDTPLEDPSVPSNASVGVEGGQAHGGYRSQPPLLKKHCSRWDQPPASSQLALQVDSEHLTHPQDSTQHEVTSKECSPAKWPCPALSPLALAPAPGPLPLAIALSPPSLAPALGPPVLKQASPALHSTPASNSSLQTKPRTLSSLERHTHPAQAAPATSMRSYNPGQCIDPHLPSHATGHFSPETATDASHTQIQALPGSKPSATGCAYTPLLSKHAQRTHAQTAPRVSGQPSSTNNINSRTPSSCSLTSTSERPHRRKRYRSFSDSSGDDYQLRRRRRQSTHSSREAAHRRTDRHSRLRYRSTSSSSFETSSMTTSCSDVSRYYSSGDSLAAAHGIDVPEAGEDPQYGSLNWYVQRAPGILPVISSKSMQLCYHWGEESSVSGTVDTTVWTCSTQVVSWNWAQSGTFSLASMMPSVLSPGGRRHQITC